jgi:hypothetical protein
VKITYPYVVAIFSGPQPGNARAIQCETVTAVLREGSPAVHMKPDGSAPLYTYGDAPVTADDHAAAKDALARCRGML